MSLRRWLCVATATGLSLLPRSASGETVGEKAARVVLDAANGTEEVPRFLALERGPASLSGLAGAARRSAASADRVEKALALECLARVDAAASRPLFVEALGSPYRSVRIRALRALVEMRDPGLAPTFVRVLESDPDPDLRAIAAGGLALPGAAEGRAALRKALESESPVIQRAAVRALVASGDLGFGKALLSRAMSAVGAERHRLFGLVSLVPDPELVQALAAHFEDADLETRTAAALAALAILDATR